MRLSTLATLASFLAVGAGGSCGSPDGDTRAPEAGEPAGALPFPLDSDIWTAPLHVGAGGEITVGAPSAAVSRAGYDNQPAPLPDGSGFWFTALEEHTGQTDIWRFSGGAVQRVTTSVPESEYSPTPLPDGSGLSVVRVEADSTQRLWRVPFEPGGGPAPEPILPDISPVGYHAWLSTERVAVFVVGDPPTLQVSHVTSGTVVTVARAIGRSIRTIPGQEAVSFVSMGEGVSPALMRLGDGDENPELLVPTPPGGEFHAWTPGGVALRSSGSRIYAWRPGETEWSVAADLSGHRVRVTRLAVMPDGSQIVMVVEPGEVTL